MGPLKAKNKMSMRRSSSENLLDNDKPAGPVQSSSLENIHFMSQQSSSSHAMSAKGGMRAVKGAMVEKIVDAVVKLYQPDHSHKYIDISPVSQHCHFHSTCAYKKYMHIYQQYVHALIINPLIHSVSPGTAGDEH